MTSQAAEPFDWRLIVGCWLVVLVLLFGMALQSWSGILPFTDNDDVMRMVTANDLSQGQAWQDQLEHRDNAPFGTQMHWSRLVDAPITALLLLTRPVLGIATQDWVAFIWPPLLLFGLLIVSVGLTRQLMGAGHQLPAVVLPVMSVVVLGEFAPGRVDHHNIQIILTTALMWATLAGRTRPKAALAAGLLVATSLAVGIETLPFLVGAVFAFGLFWVMDSAVARNARCFALALIGGMIVHFLVATEPSRYFVPACDQLSEVYVVAALLIGAAIIVATLAGSGLSRLARLRLILLFCSLAGALTLILFPQCRGGPYGGLDARAFDLLIAHAAEAEPLWRRFMHDPVAAFGFASTALFGLAVLVYCIAVTPSERRLEWVALAFFLALASIVLVLQVRGARLAVMPAVPAAVWLIDRARRAYGGHASAVRGGALLASWLLFAGIVQFPVLVLLAGSSPASASAGGAAAPAYFPACYLPADFKALAQLPPGIVLAPMTIGPRILRYTSDAVVSAGYHRNVAGALDVDDFLNAGEAPARNIVAWRGVRYVAACRGLPQLAISQRSAPDSFVRLWSEGQHWDWLVPISRATDTLQVFRVDLDE